MSNTNPNPEEHKRIVDAAMSKIIGKEDKPTAEMEAILDAQKTCARVQALMVPIITAAVQSGAPVRKSHLKLQMAKFFQEDFNLWSKDDLVFLLSVMHAEIIIDKLNVIEQN